MMRAAAVLVLLLIPQDQADKVRALVEKLGSDEIAVREEAHAQIVKLGPAALPALRDHLAKSAGERKSRLESAVRQIERNDKLAKLLAPGPTVTLKVKDRPAAEVLAEIAKQSGVTVEAKDLPAGTLFSLEADRLNLPAAVDELCRRHGKVMYAWEPSRVVIRPGEYRKLQSFEAGPFRFIAVGFMWYTSRGNPRYLSFDGVLVGPPGRLPPGVRIEFEAVQDDQGNNLGATRPGTSFILGGLEWSAANPAELRVARPVSQYTNNTPVDEAVKLTKCRGRVRLAFVLGGRRILTLKDPGAGRKAESEGTSLVIEAWDRAAGRLTLRYCVEQIETDEAGESRGPAKAIWIAIHDAAGRRLEGEQKEVRILGIMSAGSVSDRSQGTLVVTVPPGFEPASVDLMEDTDVEEVMIPFDLGEVTLPARRQPKADR